MDLPKPPIEIHIKSTKLRSIENREVTIEEITRDILRKIVGKILSKTIGEVISFFLYIYIYMLSCSCYRFDNIIHVITARYTKILR